MKSNPLFVDSTKFRGDPVNTQVELKNVLIYDDESLFVMVKNHQGVTRRVAMKDVEGRGYEARVHLNHQTPISFQFLIEKQGQVFMVSPVYQGRAQYALIQIWEGKEFDASVDEILQETPFVTTPGGSPPSAKVHQQAQPPTEKSSTQSSSSSWARESSQAVRSLIDKWGL